MATQTTKVAIIGAGITGISTAYYLAKRHGITDVLLIDAGQPMAFTSAQSGENYRNWWPHPSMVAFTNHSIDLLEEVANDSNNRINMNRRGYALATRNTGIHELLGQLHAGLGDTADDLLRFHTTASSTSYAPPISADWQSAPIGVDIMQNQDLIRSTFPSYAPDIQTVVHIRRGGDISGQQLGMYMLEAYREAGGKRMTGTVKDIVHSDHYSLTVNTADGNKTIKAGKIVNAAGPFADEIAEMIGVELPLHHTFQQKIAFEDKASAIPRDMPFSIDLDSQLIDWSDEDRTMLLEDRDYRWLAEEMPGAIHCRPDGGDNGTWLKLGWAYNEAPATASRDLPLNDQFPEIVLRGAARLNPTLKQYYGQLPRNMHHYGGWYTMTKENWPLIGPMGLDGAFTNCALSGFGTMVACAGGELCAAWVAGGDLPEYAHVFSMARYDDVGLMKLLQDSNKGIL